MLRLAACQAKGAKRSTSNKLWTVTTPRRAVGGTSSSRAATLSQSRSSSSVSQSSMSISQPADSSKKWAASEPQ